MTLKTEDIKEKLEDIEHKLNFDFSEPQILELIQNIQSGSNYSLYDIKRGYSNIILKFKNSDNNSISIPIFGNIIFIRTTGMDDDIKIPLFIYNKIVKNNFEEFHNNIKINLHDGSDYEDIFESFSKMRNIIDKTNNILKNIGFDIDNNNLTKYYESCGYQYFGVARKGESRDSDSDSSDSDDDTTYNIRTEYMFGIYNNEIIWDGFYTRKTNYNEVNKMTSINMEYIQIKNENIHDKLSRFMDSDIINKICGLVKKLNLSYIDMYYSSVSNFEIYLYSYPNFDHIHDPIDVIYINKDKIIVNGIPDEKFHNISNINIILTQNSIQRHIINDIPKNLDSKKIIIIYKSGTFDSFYKFDKYSAESIYDELQKNKTLKLDDFIIVNK